MAAAAATAHVQAGRLRALGAAGLRRITALPDLPTISELGYTGFDWDEWNGLWTVAGTPASSVAKLHAATVFALNQPDVQARMNQIGIVPLGTNPQQFGAFVVEQRERTARLIREANITLG
jgi:tripartite-type tricarboxylate transporter receptor subunit TctC